MLPYTVSFRYAYNRFTLAVCEGGKNLDAIFVRELWGEPRGGKGRGNLWSCVFIVNISSSHYSQATGFAMWRLCSKRNVICNSICLIRRKQREKLEL